MVVPLIFYAFALGAIALAGYFISQKPVVTAQGEAIKTEANKSTTSTSATNALGGLYQNTSTESAASPMLGSGKETSNILEPMQVSAKGGGLGGQPSVDVTTGAKPTGAATADDTNKTGGGLGIDIGSVMPLLQLTIIGLFAYLIIKEVM